MRLLLLLSLLLFLVFASSLTLNSSSSVVETIYYNGTVVIRTYNQSEVYLPLQNISKLQSSSTLLFRNGYVVLKNPSSVIIYESKIDGVIKVLQPYNSTICIILPYESRLLYLYPAPQASTITQNGLLNLTFYGSNLTVVFSPPPYTAHPTSTANNSNNLLIILIILLVISTISTGTLVYLFISNLRKKVPEERIEETEVVIDTNKLDDRDKVVLEAIRQGADTLAKISRMTGLPRTTAYRRVKKLVSLGYVEEIRERNKIRYIANKNVGENDSNI
ncbi:helix-turn-helix transcriptional regulator [Stygiolobus caldivivus]|uniref:Transcriptional regulator n=1 Tax=Stygiolobus caldivivus TaxID=2824673 RepID=A0A8D5U5D1_9CREN|nr:helix-turn-helix domain-containing protein [Stygiolobus caldivivus]BCU69365.1 transcriptional regulator [Stygiolobus caldivivus]